MRLLLLIQNEFNSLTGIQLVIKCRRAKWTDDRVLAISKIEDHVLSIFLHTCRLRSFTVHMDFSDFVGSEAVR